MRRFLFLAVISLLLPLNMSTAWARPRAIVTDGSDARADDSQAGIVGAPNSEAWGLLIYTPANGGADYVALDQLNAPALLCSQATTCNACPIGTCSAQPGVPVSFGLVDVTGALNLKLVNTTDSNASFSSQSSTPTSDTYKTFSAYMDWIEQDYSNYSDHIDALKNDTPPYTFPPLPLDIASELAGKPSVMFVAWQDKVGCAQLQPNDPDSSDPCSTDNNSTDWTDPYTYDSLIMAVWFEPKSVDAPEPATFGLLTAGLFGVGCLRRKRGA